jgi:restriction system protein
MLVAEREYELPILSYLDGCGGRAPSREVVEAVGRALADRLTELDNRPLQSGGIRWQKRTAFVRLRLVERGELLADSPRGTWEISDKGRERLRSL